MHRYEEWVLIADDHDDFVDAVGRCLRGERRPTPTRRRAAVAAASWDVRADEFIAVAESVGRVAMCGIVGHPPLRRRAGQRGAAAGHDRRASTHRGPTARATGSTARSASVTGASRSSTWPARPSRWPPPTSRCTSPSTARSSTSASCGDGCDYPFRTSGDTEVAARRCSSAKAVDRSSGCGASSPTRSTTATDDLVAVPRPPRRPAAVSPTATPTCSRSPPSSRRCCRRCRRPRRSTWPASTPTSSRRAVPAPHTLFEDVKKLLPGHRMRVGPDRALESEPYWSVPSGAPRRVHRRRGRASWSSDGLEDAVGSALVADVPVGALLSGGVDSSLIVALATKLRGGEPVDTFSAGFGDPRYDELPHARRGEQGRSAPTTTRSWSSRRTSRTCGRRSPGTATRRSPSRPTSPCSSWPPLARQSVKVLLSGEGSDELFAGYPKYQMARFTNLADVLPAWLRASAFGELERRLPASAGRARIALRALAAPTEVDRLASWFAPFTAPERRHAAGGGPRARRTTGPARSGADAIERMLAFDCQGWLADNLLERGRPDVDGGVGRAAAAVPRPPPGRAGLLPALAGEGPPGRRRSGSSRRSLAGTCPRASSTGARSGSGSRSTRGSATTCARWRATCSSVRARSWAPRSTPRSVRSLLDTHDVGSPRRVDPHLDAALARGLARRLLPQRRRRRRPRLHAAAPAMPDAAAPLHAQVTVVVVTYNSSRAHRGVRRQRPGRASRRRVRGDRPRQRLVRRHRRPGRAAVAPGPPRPIAGEPRLRPGVQRGRCAQLEPVRPAAQPRRRDAARMPGRAARPGPTPARGRAATAAASYTSDGEVDPMSCWGRPTLWSMLCFATGLSTAFAGSARFNREGIGSWPRDVERPVDIVSGCLLLADRQRLAAPRRVRRALLHVRRGLRPRASGRPAGLPRR